MYVPAHFSETRTETLRKLIKEFPLGSLVTHGVNARGACRNLEERGQTDVARAMRET